MRSPNIVSIIRVCHDRSPKHAPEDIHVFSPSEQNGEGICFFESCHDYVSNTFLLTFIRILSVQVHVSF